jgi:hypothetical protein
VRRDGGLGADRGHLELGEDEPQRLGGPDPGGPPAVADDPGGLVVPLPVDVVQGVLQGSGKGVVVLGNEEDEAVEAVDEFAPGAGVVVLVLLEVRVARLVEVAELVVGKVDEFVVGAAVGTGSLQCPGGDLVAAASGAGASEDECDAK